MLRVLADTESQEAQGLLEEIRRQSSVSVLSGPAIVITNVATASVLLAKGWSTESVSRVVRTARTTQEKHEKERAEHAYYNHIPDEVTVYDAFPATIQKLDEDENLPEDTEAQDDQEDETEQSLSESLQTRRQISKIHENMGHPSNRTLVRVLRLGGVKRRFILAPARHRCGSCEAQKRPAGPIVSRSPTSFLFNDVVGLDLFFLNTYEKHTLLAMNIVCWGTGLQRVIPRFKTKTSISRINRIAQILEREQSLLQHCNVTQIARLVFYKAMDPTLHYKMKADEAYDGSGERAAGLGVCTQRKLRRRLGDTRNRSRNRDRNRQLSTLIVNIETDAQTE